MRAWERNQTITVLAAPYGDEDDCLAAAEADVRDRYGLAGWDLAPRWSDDERDEIALTIPAWAARGEEPPP